MPIFYKKLKPYFLIFILLFSFLAHATDDRDFYNNELFWAISTGYFDKVKRLIMNENIDINAEVSITGKNDKQIFLHQAVSRNDERIVEALLRHPNIEVSIEGAAKNILHLGAEYARNERIIKLLLNHKHVTVDMINAKNQNGFTPLQVALYISRGVHRKNRDLGQIGQSIVDAFLSDPRVHVDDFELFKFAIDANDLKKVEKLLADERVNNNVRQRAFGSGGLTVLHYAVGSKSNVKIIEALLRYVDVNAESGGMTPLEYGIHLRKIDGKVVKAFLSHPNIDLKRKEVTGYNRVLYEFFLQQRWKPDNKQVVEILFQDPRIDINEIRADGKTIIEDVASRSHNYFL